MRGLACRVGEERGCTLLPGVHTPPCLLHSPLPPLHPLPRRNIANAHQRTVQGNYSLNGLVGFEMFNKTVGVISTGAIGYEACRILKVCRPGRGGGWGERGCTLP